MKARNFIIIIVIQYLLLVFVSAVFELSVISSRAKEVKELIMAAADMALEQVQLVDDFMGYNANKERLMLPFPSRNGEGFVKTDLFLATTGYDSTDPNNKKKIFDYLYNSPTSNDLRILAARASSIRVPVRYWTGGVPGNPLSWYYIPKLSLMGTEIFGTSGTQALRIRDAGGNYTDPAFDQSLYTTYGLLSPYRTTGGEDYYNTPLNLGVTYINRDLLAKLFINNVDNLMREKYNGHANLNTAKGGDGILVGQTFTNEQIATLEEYNPINNGSFSVLRGEEFYNGSDARVFMGVQPDISYKVIDMYDPANDEMLKILFGGYTGGFSSKAQYLKDLDKHIINPATGRPYDSKPIVVAKVTFYLDVVIPYFMVTNRDFRQSLANGDHMFDIQPVGGVDTVVDGARRISYTRFFAVTP